MDMDASPHRKTQFPQQTAGNCSVVSIASHIELLGSQSWEVFHTNFQGGYHQNHQNHQNKAILMGHNCSKLSKPSKQNAGDLGVSPAFSIGSDQSEPSCFAHVNGLRRGFSTWNMKRSQFKVGHTWTEQTWTFSVEIWILCRRKFGTEAVVMVIWCHLNGEMWWCMVINPWIFGRFMVSKGSVASSVFAHPDEKPAPCGRCIEHGEINHCRAVGNSSSTSMEFRWIKHHPVNSSQNWDNLFEHGWNMVV